MCSLQEIKNAYFEIEKMFNGIWSVPALKRLEKDFGLTLEINGYDSCDAEEDANVDYFRIDSYKMLSYIYFNCNRKEHTQRIFFDVWSDIMESDIINDITIDDLEVQYYIHKDRGEI